MCAEEIKRVSILHRNYPSLSRHRIGSGEGVKLAFCIRMIFHMDIHHLDVKSSCGRTFKIITNNAIIIILPSVNDL